MDEGKLLMAILANYMISKYKQHCRIFLPLLTNVFGDTHCTCSALVFTTMWETCCNMYVCYLPGPLGTLRLGRMDRP